MKDKELAFVNIILFVILIVLAIVSINNQQTVSVFLSQEQPIYKVDTNDKVLGIMCNVYWGTEYIEPYLNLFDELNVKATFFIGGSWAADNPELVEKIYKSGHEIGNHGYSHKLASKNDYSTMKNELLKTDQLLTQICGRKPTLYAPPSGDFNKDTIEIAMNNGYNTIMWSIDTIDWRDKDTEKIKRRISDNVKPGAFILLHPTKNTLDALTQIIPELKEEQFEFKTISDMLK